jgi:hypothetical protein
VGSHECLGRPDNTGSSLRGGCLRFRVVPPITTLVSVMESEGQVSHNAAIARKTWNWSQAERKKRIDAVASIAGSNLEFYKN